MSNATELIKKINKEMQDYEQSLVDTYSKTNLISVLRDKSYEYTIINEVYDTLNGIADSLDEEVIDVLLKVPSVLECYKEVFYNTDFSVLGDWELLTEIVINDNKPSIERSFK